MKTIWRKLTSRKLWLAIAGVAAGLAVALGAEAGQIEGVAGAVTALMSVVAYITAEGKIDAEGIKAALADITEREEAADDGA